MIDGINSIATDCDYVMLQPSFDPYARPVFHFLERVNPEVKEGFIRAISGLPEYALAEVLFRINPLSAKPTALVSSKTFKNVHKKFKVGVFSRRPGGEVNNNLAIRGYRVDVVVGREDVGIGVIERKHIDLCIKRLEAKPETTLVVSDSPKDLRRGKRLGAKTCGVNSGYHSKEEILMCNPTAVFPSAEELFVSLYELKI